MYDSMGSHRVTVASSTQAMVHVRVSRASPMDTASCTGRQSPEATLRNGKLPQGWQSFASRMRQSNLKLKQMPEQQTILRISYRKTIWDYVNSYFWSYVCWLILIHIDNSCPKLHYGDEHFCQPLRCPYPLVRVPAFDFHHWVPNSSSLLTYTWEAAVMAQVMGCLPPRGRPGLSPSCCRHLWSKLRLEDSVLSRALSLSLTPHFK